VKETTELTFEQAFRQLEDVIRQLEGGALPLEQSLVLFEEGMRLAKLCEKKLDEAEQRVSQLIGDTEEAPTLSPFTMDE
jgi:exodeoxyribonuclease VII small subunit